MNINNNNDLETVSLKDLRENYYELKKFEISNLWQRSVFLAAFIIAGITAYCSIISCLFDSGCSCGDTFSKDTLHVICVIIACINCIFSALWIMMAKGSKAWQEIYESYVDDIEKEPELKLPEKYLHGNKHRGNGHIDQNLFSTNAGAFSPSKINIFIGQFFMCIWGLAGLLHAAIYIVQSFNLYKKLLANTEFWLSILTLCIIIVCIFVIIRLKNKAVKSGFIESSIHHN